MNLSLNKSTSQSSTNTQDVYTYASHLAVDGDRKTIGNRAGCTHTNFDANAWWKVVLSPTQEYFIKNITIYNRSDCCSERLSDSDIYIIRNNIKQHCTNVGNMTNIEVKTFGCSKRDIRGNEVLIEKSNSILTLCEVEVYGKKLN